MPPLILPPRCLAALLFLGALPSTAAPLITEFMTNNNSGILDEDLTRQAWIEIHQDELAAAWQMAVNGFRPGKIAPLQ